MWRTHHKRKRQFVLPLRLSIFRAYGKTCFRAIHIMYSQHVWLKTCFSAIHFMYSQHIWLKTCFSTIHIMYSQHIWLAVMLRQLCSLHTISTMKSEVHKLSFSFFFFTLLRRTRRVTLGKLCNGIFSFMPQLLTKWLQQAYWCSN